jgi:transcriptional regulator with XRE-family HTH domain
MDLAEARFHKKMTQWDLKARTGISQTKISLIERGFVPARDEEKARLAKALGMRADQIDWPDPGLTTGDPNVCEAH